MFLLRFDMRAPQADASARADLYAAAVDMGAWAESKGALAAVISEHHASPDGYLPSPLILASAIAARTTTLPIQIAALILPYHDPVRLAEDIAVLDILSRGRVSYVLGLGYRPEEYAMFGVPMKGRGRYMEDCARTLNAALSGREFVYQGRPVRITPEPFTPGGPYMFMGGSTAAAARRAARCDMGLYAQSGDPGLEEIYRIECERLGHVPKVCVMPPPGLVTSAFVADDPDRAWHELGGYLLHDAQMYAEWLGDAPSTVKNTASSVAELRADPGSYRIFTADEAVDYIRQNGVLIMQPLCGGIPPKLAWRSLELLADEVLPRLSDRESPAQ